MRRAAWIVLCSGLGCGGAGAADDIDVMAEAADASSRASASTAIADAKGVSSLFVKEDPTLDVTKTAAANADAVATQLSASVCATATVTHAAGSVTVGVDFGAGCTIAKLGTVSGAASVTVGKQITKLTVDC